MSIARRLEARGFTNKGTEDLGVLAMGKPRLPQAFCYSAICTRSNDALKKVLKKNVKPNEQFCPDCTHALFWK